MYLAIYQCQRQEVQGLLCRNSVIHWEIDKRLERDILGCLKEYWPVDGFYDIGTFLQSSSQVFIGAFVANFGRVNDKMKEIIRFTNLVPFPPEPLLAQELQAPTVPRFLYEVSLPNYGQCT